MRIIVQKFGGTSVQSENNRKYVLEHIKRALIDNFKIIVVVSALGRKPDPYATDTLLDLVQNPVDHTSKLELDLLLSCGEIIAAVVLSNELQRNNLSSLALTGAQAGLLTNNNFTNAKIKKINPHRLLESFKVYDVLVIAGFQGQTITGEITTLGRGGSDTSATSLAAAVKAERMEIFSDVRGVMTADPAIVKSAQQLDNITYTELCNLAYQGAKIIHPRAIEIAMQANIPLHVRSTSSKNVGTFVTAVQTKPPGLKSPKRFFTSITQSNLLTQINVNLSGNLHNKQFSIFKNMKSINILTDFIYFSPSKITFTIPSYTTSKAVMKLKKLNYTYKTRKNCVKISLIINQGFSNPITTTEIVNVLTNQNIQILQTSNSQATISVLIKKEDAELAIYTLHKQFLKTNSLIPKGEIR